MRIVITLSDALDRCYNWSDFCEEFGLDEYCVNTGYGDSEVTLTEEQAIKHGIIKRQEYTY